VRGGAVMGSFVDGSQLVTPRGKKRCVQRVGGQDLLGALKGILGMGQNGRSPL
jgi:hypothetical protein